MVAETAVPDGSGTESPTGHSPTGHGHTGHRHFGRRAIAPAAATFLTVLVLAPVISVLAQRAGRPYLPMQDSAVTDLRLRDVLAFTPDTPLVGAYSHFGWNHPGPAALYLVAPFAWLFGNAAWATLVGFALLQGVAVVWTARLAWKTGGLRWTAIWMGIMALTYVGAGPAILQAAWNPSVALPFFVLFLLQCWVVSGGDAARLAGIAFVGTFLVQAHIGYAVLVALLGGWSLAHLAVDLRRRRRRPGLLDLVAPAAVLVVMWFPPIVLDPLIHGSSNLGRLAHFYLHPSPLFPHAGLVTGLGFLATEFRWLPPWLGGSEPVNQILRQDALPSTLVWLAAPAALLAGGWWSARRSRRKDLVRLVELVALCLLGSAFSLAMIQGERSLYLFYWRVVTGVATVVLLLTVLVERPVPRPIRRAWPAVLAVVAILGCLSVAPAAGNGRGPHAGLEPAASEILGQLRQTGQPDGSALVRGWGETTGGLAASLIDQLSREGKAVFVDRSLGFEFGYGRTAGPTDVRWALYVTESSAIFHFGERIPGATVLARTHPLPAAEEADLARLQVDLLAQLDAHGAALDAEDLGSPYVASELAHVPALDRSEIQRLARLNTLVARHGCLCAVIAFHADRGLTYNPDYMASLFRGPHLASQHGDAS